MLLTSWTSPAGGKVWRDGLAYARKEKGWRPDGGEVGEGGLVWHGVEQGFKEVDANDRGGGLGLTSLVFWGGVVCIAYYAVSSRC